MDHHRIDFTDIMPTEVITNHRNLILDQILKSNFIVLGVIQYLLHYDAIRARRECDYKQKYETSVSLPFRAQTEDPVGR